MKNDADWSGITLTCAGSGKLQVLFNETIAGTVEISDGQNLKLKVAAEVPGGHGQSRKVSSEITAPAGEAELKLRIIESDSLEIMEIVLK